MSNLFNWLMAGLVSIGLIYALTYLISKAYFRAKKDFIQDISGEKNGEER